LTNAKKGAGKRSHFPNVDTDYNIHQEGSDQFFMIFLAYISAGNAAADAITKAQDAIKLLDQLERTVDEKQ
jgi:hypothetical protein